jgi:hypothetical protein
MVTSLPVVGSRIVTGIPPLLPCLSSPEMWSKLDRSRGCIQFSTLVLGYRDHRVLHSDMDGQI